VTSEREANRYQRSSRLINRTRHSDRVWPSYAVRPVYVAEFGWTLSEYGLGARARCTTVTTLADDLGGP
jgi:hypothetical protein